jgi:hypothetical protein
MLERPLAASSLLPQDKESRCEYSTASCSAQRSRTERCRRHAAMHHTTVCLTAICYQFYPPDGKNTRVRGELKGGRSTLCVLASGGHRSPKRGNGDLKARTAPDVDWCHKLNLFHPFREKNKHCLRHF